MEVYFRPPTLSEAVGEYRRLAGDPPREVIDLKPGLDPDEMLAIFLHESAHACLHRETTAETLAEEESGSRRLPPEIDYEKILEIRAALDYNSINSHRNLFLK